MFIIYKYRIKESMQFITRTNIMNEKAHGNDLNKILSYTV